MDEGSRLTLPQAAYQVCGHCKDKHDYGALFDAKLFVAKRLLIISESFAIRETVLLSMLVSQEITFRVVLLPYLL